MPVYGTVKRSGEGVMQCSDCVSCRLRDACSVDDVHLRIWMDYGMGCVCYTPKSVWSSGGSCAV